MNRKNTNKFILVIISLVLTLNIFTIGAYASPKEAEKIKNFIEKNESLLTNENKKNLEGIIEKLDNYEVISQEEREYIRECELNVIREKLGDAQYDEYMKLLEKRRSSENFEQSDRLRLYQLEKLLK
ncbi:hypothetical protein [Clostridium celatum]|uniref:Uncharacterized protein n=1 Tax=Clostridium celatum DSM 1785 TaxID=545697 RepID=L1QDM7_9CLOT|nr:hypothetical protein [Clostridium celatum]EKY26089.1 hypothetical protein HMPREF0216_02128 [Clostridium celatum DSM 1785]MCE9654230.1 hypothetical protein [Clostridium celatum]MDU6294729.1 hypothetical protein [Clostridium celatum]MDY3361811.1 hypothetical protein [Clostridium celatum]